MTTDLGTTAAQPVAATSTTAPAAAPASGGVLSNVFSFLSGPLTPSFTGTSFLPNAGLVLVGIVLAIGALLISQKETVVQVAARAAV